jgi:hypothetical protein
VKSLGILEEKRDAIVKGIPGKPEMDTAVKEAGTE